MSSADPTSDLPGAQFTEPRASYAWYVVFVLCVCGIVAFIDRQIINLLVEDIKRDLLVTDTQISLLQGFAFVIFYATVAIPLGRLADTRSRRILIAVGIVVWTFAAFACGLADSYGELFVARIFIGIGEAVLTPAGYSLLADYFRPSRLALPISVFTGASFMGSGVALLAGGFIIGLLGSGPVDMPLLGMRADWQAAFIIGASPGFVVALLFFFTVREPVRRRLPGADTIEQAAASWRDITAFVREHAGVYLAVFVGLSLLSAAQFSLGAWTPAFFIRVHGWTAAEVGYAYGIIFLFFATSGVIGGGWVANRLHARGYQDANLRTAMLGALLALPFAIAYPLADSGRTAIILLAPLVGFGSIPFGAGTAVIPVITPSRFRAQLVATYLLVANLIGQAGGPWMVALFTDRVFKTPESVGYSLLVVVSTVLIVGTAVIWVGLPGLRRVVGLQSVT
jgi:MFS family permease